MFILNDISVGRIKSGNYVRISDTIYEGNAEGFALLKKVDTLVTDGNHGRGHSGEAVKIVADTGAAEW